MKWSLKNASKPVAKPPILTLVGSPGTGKTTLGALFPAPVFINTEDGTTAFEGWPQDKQPVMFPRLPRATKARSSRQILNAMVQELIDTDHPFKTLVVDSVTTLNSLLEHEICVRDGKESVAEAAGGYHKGFGVVASWHADFIRSCEKLRHLKKMAVVFLAHTGTQRVKNSPDGSSDYTIYTMAMPPESMGPYSVISDGMFFLTKHALVTPAEVDNRGRTTKYGRVIETGERILITSADSHMGYTMAKARFPIPAKLTVEYGQNPILPYSEFFRNLIGGKNE